MRDAALGWFSACGRIPPSDIEPIDTSFTCAEFYAECLCQLRKVQLTRKLKSLIFYSHIYSF